MRHPLQTILTLLISAFLLTGCPHLEPVESQREAFETWNEAQSGYRFLPGDELDIKLLYNPAVSSTKRNTVNDIPELASEPAAAFRCKPEVGSETREFF